MKNFINIKHPVVPMLFKKPLSEVEFPDIQKLKAAKIEDLQF